MKNILLTVDDQGVSGIIAPLKTDNIIRITGQQINDFAFTFITPLGADTLPHWPCSLHYVFSKKRFHR